MPRLTKGRRILVASGPRRRRWSISGIGDEHAEDDAAQLAGEAAQSSPVALAWGSLALVVGARLVVPADLAERDKQKRAFQMAVIALA